MMEHPGYRLTRGFFFRCTLRLGSIRRWVLDVTHQKRKPEQVRSHFHLDSSVCHCIPASFVVSSFSVYRRCPVCRSFPFCEISVSHFVWLVTVGPRSRPRCLVSRKTVERNFPFVYHNDLDAPVVFFEFFHYWPPSFKP